MNLAGGRGTFVETERRPIVLSTRAKLAMLTRLERTGEGCLV